VIDDEPTSGSASTADASADPDNLEERVEELSRGWDHREGGMSRLLDYVTGPLSEQASHELRQIFTMLYTQLELASHRSEEPGARLDADTVDRMLGEIDRGSAIAGTYLDRQEIAKALIRLETRDVDLAQLLAGLVQRNGLDPDREDVDTDMQPTQVEADREKIARVLDFLVTWLGGTTTDDGRLAVHVDGDPEGACVFVGVEPCSLDRKDLVERLVQRFSLDALSIDVPYVRAVVERHGGAIYVAEREPGYLGYELEIPTGADRS
jgi:signal transduction histidine kinase